jgi:hypothetical protein
VLPRHSRERSNAQNRDFGSLRSTSTGTRVMRQRWTSGEHSPVRQQQLPPPSEQLIAVHIMTSRHDRHRRPSLGPTRCPPPVCTTPPPRAPYFSRIRTRDPQTSPSAKSESSNFRFARDLRAGGNRIRNPRSPGAGRWFLVETYQENPDFRRSDQPEMRPQNSSSHSKASGVGGG